MAVEAKIREAVSKATTSPPGRILHYTRICILSVQAGRYMLALPDGAKTIGKITRESVYAEEDYRR